MTTIAFPQLSRAAPDSLTWQLLSNTQRFTSPLNGAVQTIELPGARWACSFGYETLLNADAAALQSFLAQLRGMANRAAIYYFARQQPLGVASGTPVVNGGGQTGASLNTAGWTAGVAGILKAGDFFGVNGELKMSIADASSNGSGVATIQFEPPLRASPPSGIALALNRPTCLMIPTEPRSEWHIRAGNPSSQFHNIQLSFMEVFA